MKVYGDDDPDDDADDEIAVGLAEYAVATEGERLTSSGLGSCVAVALRDLDDGIGGLLHSMLPSSSEIDDDNAAKFADTGVETLIRRMERNGADRDRMEAKIVGGAHMLDLDSKKRLIGTRNVRAIREKLEQMEIPVVGEDTGGDYGRSITFDPHSGELTVTGPHTRSETV